MAVWCLGILVSTPVWMVSMKKGYISLWWPGSGVWQAQVTRRGQGGSEDKPGWDLPL